MFSVQVSHSDCTEQSLPTVLLPFHTGHRKRKTEAPAVLVPKVYRLLPQGTELHGGKRNFWMYPLVIRWGHRRCWQIMCCYIRGTHRSARSVPKAEGTVQKWEIQSFPAVEVYCWEWPLQNGTEEGRDPWAKPNCCWLKQEREEASGWKKELLCTYGQGEARRPSPPVSVAVFLA